MKIKIGQITHVKAKPNDYENSEIIDYQLLTKGTYEKGADIQKGIWGYKEVKEPNSTMLRRPAIILLSNSYK